MTTSRPDQADRFADSTSAPEQAGETLPLEQSAAVTPPAQLPANLGQYRIIKQLGAGGMGAVYAAEDTELNRLVALKVPQFRAGTNDELLARFHREARSVASLAHPAICPLYDFGNLTGQPFLAMAYIHGQSLAERLEAGPPLREREAAELVATLADALDYAHRRGVIHRDLKPQNIMLDEQSQPVILDFGLARTQAIDDGLQTQSGLILGTPAYISPEQAGGQSRAVGPASDIYSLGAVLYECLAGRRLFTGSPAELLGKHLYLVPDPCSKHAPGVAPELEALCLKMLAKAPEDRPASMAEVAQTLGQWLGERRRLADVEDASGRLGWWLPASLVVGGTGLGYYAWWLWTPGDETAFDLVWNLVMCGPLAAVGLAMWLVAGWLLVKRSK